MSAINRICDFVNKYKSRHCANLKWEANRLYQTTSPGDRIIVRNNGFYRDGIKIAGNERLSNRIFNQGLPTKFEITNDISPKDIINYFRLNYREDNICTRRDFLLKNISACIFLSSYSLSVSHRIEIEQFYTKKYDGKDIVCIDTPQAKIFGWFSPHTGKYLMPFNELKKIKDNEPLLIFVPETIFVSAEDPSMELRPSSFKKYYLRNIFNNQFFDQNSIGYIYKNSLPMFLADMFLTKQEEVVKNNFKNQNINKDYVLSLSSYMITGASVTLATSAFVPPKISRREAFFRMLGTVSAIPLLSLYAPFNKSLLGLLKKITGGNRDVIIDFRNALIAAKLLKFAQYANDKLGFKPSFLLTMGSKHSTIMKNIEKGLEYNLAILKQYDFYTSLLRDSWDKGYLLDYGDQLPLDWTSSIFSIQKGFLAGARKKNR